MAIFTEYEKRVLGKYVEGNRIPNEEEDKVLTRYANIGFVKFGFNWRNNEPTAKLTDLGVKHLNREISVS